MLAKQMLAATPPRRHLPFVTTLHGTDITLVGLDRSYLPITRFSIEQSDGVTAVSQYLRGRTISMFDIKNHIEVIPNFVNCDEYVRTAGNQEQRREYAGMTNASWSICRIFTGEDCSMSSRSSTA
jgi:glycosyltransferase involved in cell wall biosynthesis